MTDTAKAGPDSGAPATKRRIRALTTEFVARFDWSIFGGLLLVIDTTNRIALVLSVGAQTGDRLSCVPLAAQVMVDEILVLGI